LAPYDPRFRKWESLRLKRIKVSVKRRDLSVCISGSWGDIGGQIKKKIRICS